MVKTITTQRDFLKIDEKRRLLLGENAGAASPGAQQSAIVLAELAVKVLEAPKWWSDAQNGLDVEDDNIIGEIYGLTVKAELERKEKLQEESKAALERLAAKDSKEEKTSKKK
jgi:hypothetical protein